METFVQLPDEQKAAIVGLIVSLFALGVDYLIGVLPPWLGWLGDFLKKYQQEWALVVATAFVTWLENFLPTGYEDVSIKGIAFLLAVVAIFVPYLLVRNLAKRRGVKAFQ